MIDLACKNYGNQGRLLFVIGKKNKEIISDPVELRLIEERIESYNGSHPFFQFFMRIFWRIFHCESLLHYLKISETLKQASEKLSELSLNESTTEWISIQSFFREFLSFITKLEIGNLRMSLSSVIQYIEDEKIQVGGTFAIFPINSNDQAESDVCDSETKIGGLSERIEKHGGEIDKLLPEFKSSMAEELERLRLEIRSSVSTDTRLAQDTLLVDAAENRANSPV
jgi:hypothetical protein